MRSSYRKIGDFIKPVKEKNKELEYSRLLGINIDKFFMPSVANVVGTNMRNYKIVRPNQFACNRMHVGRDYRIPIALSREKAPFLVSPAYDVFEITKPDELEAEYLMMWFSRKEFDRNAWFYTDADVRGGLAWDAFCGMELPVPPIAQQRTIVAEYKTVVNRIKLNETLNQKLEETAQALYRHWFVEFEFPNEDGKPYKSFGGAMVYNEKLDKEIPEGWEVVEMNYFSEICSSKRIFQSEYTDNGIPFYRGKEITLKKSGKPIDDILFISEKRYLELKNKYGKPSKGDILLTAVGTIGSSYLVQEEEFYFKDGNIIWLRNFKSKLFSTYIYSFMQSSQFEKLIQDITIGSTQKAITINALSGYKILCPPNSILIIFKKLIEQLTNNTILNNKENQKLNEIQSLFLSKMTRVEIQEESVV